MKYSHLNIQDQSNMYGVDVIISQGIISEELRLEDIITDNEVMDQLSFVDLVGLNITAIWNQQDVDIEHILTTASLSATKVELKMANRLVGDLINHIESFHENYGTARRFNNMMNYIITGAYMRLQPKTYPNPYEELHQLYRRKKSIVEVMVPALKENDLDRLQVAGKIIVDSIMEARDSTIECIVDIAVDYYDQYSTNPTSEVIVNKCIGVLTDLNVGRNGEIHRLVEDRYYTRCV